MYYDRDFIKEFDKLINEKPMSAEEWAITIHETHKYDVRRQAKNNPDYDFNYDKYKGYFISYSQDARLVNPSFAPQWVGICKLEKIKKVLIILQELTKDCKGFAPAACEIYKECFIKILSLIEHDVGDNINLMNTIKNMLK